MNDLYLKDESITILKLKKKIESYFTGEEFNQNAVNHYMDLKSYEFFRNNIDQDYKDYINYLCIQFVKYLDLSKEEFFSGFTGNHRSRIYELAMACFINDSFELIQRPDKAKQLKVGDLADLEFKYNGKTYFLECTIRSTSRLDQYIKSFSHSDNFFKIAEILHQKHKKLVVLDRIWERTNWCSEAVFLRLTAQEKEIIKNLALPLNVEDSGEFIEYLEKRVVFIQGIYWDYKNILDMDIKEIEEYIIPTFIVEKGLFKPNHLKFLVGSIALKILEKLEKPYFSKNIPTIISVSLASVASAMDTVMALSYCKNLDKLLLDELNSCINSGRYTEEKVSNLSKRLKSLYAIIIDYSWYNWFPDIAVEKLGGHFPEGYNNCYHIIYNTNLSGNLSYDESIFASSINTSYFLDFEIRLSVKEVAFDMEQEI